MLRTPDGALCQIIIHLEGASKPLDYTLGFTYSLRMTKDELHLKAARAAEDYWDKVTCYEPCYLRDLEGMVDVIAKALCGAPFKEPGDFRYYPCEISKQTFIPPDLEN